MSSTPSTIIPIPSRLSGQVYPSSNLRLTSNLSDERATQQNNANDALKHVQNPLASSWMGSDENAFSQMSFHTGGLPNAASSWPYVADSRRAVPNSSASVQQNQLQNFNADMANRVGKPASQTLWPGTLPNSQAAGYSPGVWPQYQNGTYPSPSQNPPSIPSTAEIPDVAGRPNFNSQSTEMNNAAVMNQGHPFPSSFNATSQTPQAPHPTQLLNPREMNSQHSTTGQQNPSRTESVRNANANSGPSTAHPGNSAHSVSESQPGADGVWSRENALPNRALSSKMTASNVMRMPQQMSTPNPFAGTSKSNRVVGPRKRRGRPLKSTCPSSPPFKRFRRSGPPAPRPTLTSLPPTDVRTKSPFLLCQDGTFSCQYQGAAAGPFGCGVVGITGEENKDCHMSAHAFAEERMIEDELLNPDRIWALLWTQKIRETCPEPGCGFTEVAWRMEGVLERHRKEEHPNEADEMDSDSEEDHDDDGEEWD